MEGLTMELSSNYHDNPGSSSNPKSPIHSEEDESKFSCPSPLITEPAAGKYLEPTIIS